MPSHYQKALASVIRERMAEEDDLERIANLKFDCERLLTKIGWLENNPDSFVSEDEVNHILIRLALTAERANLI
jgi:hypothetical protein